MGLPGLVARGSSLAAKVVRKRGRVSAAAAVAAVVTAVAAEQLPKEHGRDC